MQDGVLALLAEAGIRVRQTSRGYRPTLSVPGFEAKILKPQNIIEMLHQGSRDLGFAGADWVAELGVELVEVLDTGLDPIRMVAAASKELAAALRAGRGPEGRPLVVASEYESLTRTWLTRRGLSAHFVRSYGATEVFPPEDADCIVDNTATGATLVTNNLEIVDELMTSSTRLYVNRGVLQDPPRKKAVEDFVLLLQSVLEARRRVMLEVNVSAESLEALCRVLPCMREPTIAKLHGESGYAVKAAVLRAELPRLIPLIKAQGGTDLVVSGIAQIVP